MQKLPVGRIVGLAYTFTFGQIGTLIGLVWIPAVITAVAGFFASGGYYDAMAQSTPADMPATGGPQIAFFLLYLVGAMLLAAIMAVAVAKQALTLREGPAFAHIELGGQEFRVFGGFIGIYLVVVLFMMAVLLVAGGAGLIAAAVMKTNPMLAALGAGFVGLVAVAGLLAVLFIAVRLSFLFIPAAIVDGEFGVTRSWELTKGNFWRIVAIGVAVLGPVLIVVCVAEFFILGPGYVALLTKMIHDPANAATYQVDQMRLMQQRLPFLMGLQLVITPVIQGLLISPPAFAYRLLTNKPRALPEA